jgi:hypothetical protein
VSTPQTYTITEDGRYATTDGSEVYTFTAGTVIPMSLAIDMGLEGAGYDDPVWFTANEEAAIDDRAALLDPWIAGRYYDIGMMDSLGANATTTITVNTLYATLLKIPYRLNIDQLAVYIQTLAAAASIRLGLYENGADGLPGDLIVDGGAVSVATTGQKSVTVAQSLPRDRYWVAGVSDGAPVIPHYAANSGGRFVRGGTTLADGTGNRGYTVTMAHTYGALPATFGTPSVVSNIALRLGVRVA